MVNIFIYLEEALLVIVIILTNIILHLINSSCFFIATWSLLLQWQNAKRVRTSPELILYSYFPCFLFPSLISIMTRVSCDKKQQELGRISKK